MIHADDLQAFDMNLNFVKHVFTSSEGNSAVLSTSAITPSQAVLYPNPTQGILTTGCEKNETSGPSEGNWFTQYPAHFPAPFIPVDNQPNAARIEPGKALFYDPILSIDSSISCASCHQPEHAFATLKATNPGVYGRPGTRNAPGLFNLAYQPHYLREASLPTLEMQILVPIQEHNEFAHNIVDIGEALSLIPYYDSLSRVAYGQAPGPYSISRSIAAFERTLTPHSHKTAITGPGIEFE